MISLIFKTNAKPQLFNGWVVLSARQITIHWTTTQYWDTDLLNSNISNGYHYQNSDQLRPALGDWVRVRVFKPSLCALDNRLSQQSCTLRLFMLDSNRNEFKLWGHNCVQTLSQLRSGGQVQCKVATSKRGGSSLLNSSTIWKNYTKEDHRRFHIFLI